MNPFQDDSADEDFEALFAEFSETATTATLKPGQRVKGTLIAVGSEYAFVSLGGKAEGMIPREEVVDEDQELTVTVGQEIEATVAVVGGREGGIRLSLRALKASLDDEVLREAYDNLLPVEGKVTGHNKGGFVVSIGGKEAFCPISQIELGFTDNPEAHVDQSYAFRIKEYGGGRFVVSRADLMRAEREVRLQELKGTLRVGDILDGTVESVRDFGAFVDVGGVQGLVHVSHLSWSRVQHPSEAVTQGQKVRVKVLEVDWAKERIGLSMKEAAGDPWTDLSVKAGDKITGPVVRLADFGAFVELVPGIEGLLHLSEMSWTRRVRTPADIMKVGDSIDVMVLDVNPLTKRISLGLKQLESDPWTTALGTLRPGMKVRGQVEKVADFGVFVALEQGVTGLVPNREMDTDRSANHKKSFPEGTEMEVVVMEIDSEQRRISLSRKAVREGADRVVPEGSLGDSGERMGTFGDLLKGHLGKIAPKDS